MDGAGNIFDRIEQKLSALGVNADISDLQKAAGEYDAKISNNPADLDSKIIDLELKVVMLAKLLNASIDALETRGLVAEPATAQETATQATAQVLASGPTRKVKRLRQNPATGIIEEIEDIVEDNVIVADNRVRLGGSGKGDARHDGKKPVFIQATDDEPVTAAEKKRK